MKWIRVRALLFIISISLCLGGGLAWHAYSPTLYEARASLQLPDERPLTTLQDPELINRARERLQKKWADIGLTTNPQKIPDLHGHLEFEFQLTEKLLDIHYQTTNVSMAVEELNSLIEQFLEEQKADVAARYLSDREHEQHLLNKELEKIAMELEKEKLSQAELEKEAEEQSPLATQQAQSLEKIRTLSKALAYAKLNRTETEQHIRVVQKFLNEQKSLGMVVAKLPEGRVREFIQGLLEQQRLRTEIDQNQDMQSELATIYGKNHPRLKEIDGKIALLVARQSASSLPSDFSEKKDLAQTSLILQTVQSFVDQSRTYEEELQRQLEVEQEIVDTQHRVDRELEAIIARIDVAQNRSAEIRLRLSQLDQKPPTSPILVSQAPWLSPEPISMTRETILLISLAPGLLLGLILSALWHYRPRPQSSSQRQRSVSIPSLNERRMLRQNRLQKMHS